MIGDFRFFWKENIGDFVTIPQAWDSSLNTGLGQSQLHSLWITSYFNFTALFSNLGLSWSLIQLIFWILPAILFSFFSAFYLFKHLFKDKNYSIISGIIYSLNTYFLMVLTGGQLGVSLSYSLVPLVLLTFIKLTEKLSLRNAIISGLALGFQTIFDPRIVLVTLIAVFLYSIFNFRDIIKVAKSSSITFFLPLVIAGLMNIFWILPLLLAKSSPIPQGFDSSSGFRFFSFAEFSNAISLLHPNWPENIFGKIYFLDPKFLVIPLIAFSSLLFTKNKIILYFSIISLLGIFLAKGSNPPFGEVNVWLFENLPGMSVFRDPTKWFMLIILGYSILIPYSLKEISRFFRFIPLLFVIYFLFLITPIFDQIKTHMVPQEYGQLKDFLVNEKTFSRTLWIPQWQRFGYFSNNHPAIGREEIFKGDAGEQVEQLNEEDSEEKLRNLGVKYVIVPYDFEGEIFLSDRKYDEDLYSEAVAELRETTWLKELPGFGKIAVFELENPKDRFFSLNSELEIEYGSIKPTEYKVQVKNAKEGDLLVFSEGHDKNWIAEGPGLKVKSFPRSISGQAKVMLNSFVLPEGDYELRVYYEPQKYVEAGLWASGATLFTSIAYLLYKNGKIPFKSRNVKRLKK